MTSALYESESASCELQPRRGSYRAIRRIPKVAQYLRTIRLKGGLSPSMRHLQLPLTPASTLVISRTLMPARGRVEASPLVDVKRLLLRRQDQLNLCEFSEARATRKEGLETMSAMTTASLATRVNSW